MERTWLIAYRKIFTPENTFYFQVDPSVEDYCCGGMEEAWSDHRVGIWKFGNDPSLALLYPECHETRVEAVPLLFCPSCGARIVMMSTGDYREQISVTRVMQVKKKVIIKPIKEE